MMGLLGNIEHVLVYIDFIVIIKNRWIRGWLHEGDWISLEATWFKRLPDQLAQVVLQVEVDWTIWLIINNRRLKASSEEDWSNELDFKTKEFETIQEIFIGMVNLYREIFPKHPHFLAPENKLSIKKGKDWYWGENE